MKYLVVYSGEAGDEKTLCGDEREAVELVETKLREGGGEADFQVYTAEPINFRVETVPVVTLGAGAVEAKQAETEQPEAADYPSASFTSYTTEEKSEDTNPFSSEQVFSLDS